MFLAIQSESHHAEMSYKYRCMLSSFSSNSPFMWPAISCEFVKIWRFWICSVRVTHNQTETASYSDSLLRIGNVHFKAYNNFEFSGEVNANPTPWLLSVVERSKCVVQQSVETVSFKWWEFQCRNWICTFGNKIW